MSENVLDVLTACAQRYSCRSFSDREIAREDLERIIDAGRVAPTANNVQPWDFVVVTSAATRKQIADLTDWGKFIADAPACVVVLCKDTKYFLEDGCASVVSILVAAAALGIQSCWVAGDKKAYGPEVIRILQAPPTHRLVALLPLGYAAKEGKQPAKRSLGDVIHWEKF